MTSTARGRTEGTRERIVRLLREGPKTVDQLAEVLGITLNAVRAQLTVLERDGVVRMTGERRGTRRPSHTYGLTADGERLLSQAYVPALKAILAAMASKARGEDVEEILREAGRRLAAGVGRPSGDFRSRVARALAVLEDLGGAADLEEADGRFIIRGHGCPLSEAVEVEPKTCKCVETLLAELTGARVEEHCERGERRNCTFIVTPNHGEAT